MMGAIILIAQLAYPFWLGLHQDYYSRALLYAVVLAICLTVWGPKRDEVAGRPVLALRAVFASVLAFVIANVGYGAGLLLG